MIRNILVYLLLAASMITVLADGPYPTLEYVKDDVVIETRLMTDEEYVLYRKLRRLESEFKRLEQPLRDLEKTVEADAEAIETEVIEKLNSMNFDSLDDLAVLGEIDYSKIEVMVEKIQPVIDEVTAMTSDLTDVTMEFKDRLMENHSEQAIDQIKILDDEHSDITFGRSTYSLEL